MATLRIIICVLSLILLVTYVSIGCYGQSKIDFIQHGTTILAYLNPEKIILAADARVEIVPGDFKTPKFYKDDAMKLFRLNNFVYVMAGSSHFRNISIDDLISKAFNPDSVLSANLINIQGNITTLMKNYFSLLSPLEKNYYNSQSAPLGIFTIIIAGFQNNIPSVGVIEIEIKKILEGHFAVMPRPIHYFEFTGDQTGVFSGGYQAYLKPYLDEAFSKNILDRRNIKPEDLIYLISLEAAHTEHVGKNVNYVVIDKQGFTYGCNSSDLIRQSGNILGSWR